MIIVGIILGTLAFLLVGAFVGEGLRKPDAGLFPGLVAAAWVAWPFVHWHFTGRYDFLHPGPRRYRADLPTAFGRIRDVLRETVYDYGDRWHVVTADTSINRIVADLCYFDEAQRFEPSGKFDFRSRTERLRRRIRLEVQIEPQGSQYSVVELNFSTNIEGANRTACDAIISDLRADIDEQLGPGEMVHSDSNGGLPAPPWWLIIASACSVLVLFKQACEVVFQL